MEAFNQRFSADLSYADALHLFVELPAHMAEDSAVQKRAKDNTAEQFGPTARRTTSARAS